MSVRSLVLSCSSLAALALAAPAAAQSAPASPAPTAAAAPDIIVTGFRQSLQNAARMKENSAQIQDSIVAEDIGKLPDTNIAETLQRIPGVQITRNARGEGNGYAVHGLTQVQTVLNGRVIFTTSGRSANLLDLSADILSGVDVFKTATADQVEGGLGGLINVRTARPFDFKGARLVAAASTNYSSIRGTYTPRLSALASNRWDTDLGEFGFLVGVTYERVATGAFDTNTNTYTSRGTFYDVNGNGTIGDAGDAVLSPSQVGARYTYGDRTRFTTTSSAQWKPSANLSFYVDGLYAYSNGRSLTQALNVQTSAASVTAASPFTFKDGTNIPAVATYKNAGLQSAVGATSNPYRIYQIAGGAQWKSGRLNISPEFSYTESSGLFYSDGANFTTTAPSATVDLSRVAPDITLSGVDPNNPANYKFSSFTDLVQGYLGKEYAARLDAKYKVGGFLKSIMLGARYTSHKAITDSVSATYTPTSSTPANYTGSNAAIFEATPAKLFDGTSVHLNQWTGVSLPIISDLPRVRGLLGLPTSDPAYSALSHNQVSEKVIAGYVEANFALDNSPVPLDGNVGLRAIHTSDVQSSNQSGTGGAIIPVTASNSYDSFLPSVNLRAKFRPDLFLRFAYSKALTRPDFANLSPALTLNPSSGTGSGGNPNLQPAKADQYDLSLEWYFGRSNMLAGSIFRKDVSGFNQKFAQDEVIGGVTYAISRYRNGGNGKIQGFEVNYQQFFDFLPGLLSGLGLQSNVTYVDSAIQVVGLNYSVPAESLSKYSYNVTGIYEKGPVSVRLAYNWRSKYVATTSADSAGRSLYVAPLGQLDLSMNFTVNKNISFKLDALNLTNTYRNMYYGSTLLPQISNQFDRSIEAGVRVRF